MPISGNYPFDKPILHVVDFGIIWVQEQRLLVGGKGLLIPMSFEVNAALVQPVLPGLLPGRQWRDLTCRNSSRP